MKYKAKFSLAVITRVDFIIIFKNSSNKFYE